MNIAVFFGSTTGNTEDIAERISAQLAEHQVVLLDVATASLHQVNDYDLSILGIPTWDYGHIQTDWQDSWDELDKLELSGATVALYGLGDQLGYGDWFLDAMGLLHDKMRSAGARVVGYWPTSGYDFSASKALTPEADRFVGLALDEDCQDELSDERLQQWLQQLLLEL